MIKSATLMESYNLEIILAMSITNLKALTRKDLRRVEKVLMVIKNADKINMATNNGINNQETNPSWNYIQLKHINERRHPI
jgi:hypothetical protein